MIIAFANIIFWNLFITKHELDNFFFFLNKMSDKRIKNPWNVISKKNPQSHTERT